MVLTRPLDQRSNGYVPRISLPIRHNTDIERTAWNIVTSFSKSSALALGLSDLLTHDERYAAAEEYMDIVYSLWEKSWEDGAQKWQVEPEMAYDPSKIHKVLISLAHFAIFPCPVSSFLGDVKCSELC